MTRPAIRLDVAPELGGLVRAGCVLAAPVAVGPAGEALLDEIDRTGRELFECHAGRKPGEIEGLVAARTLYKGFGIDPTRTRPSSEALLRRVLREKPLPRISNAVDLCNLLALQFLLPLGLYDADRLEGELRLRRGAPGESFTGIRKDEVHLAGRPVLSDRAGPFGNPTSDSLRTAVGESTTALLLVIFGPASLSSPAMAGKVDRAAEAMRRHLAPPGAAVRTVGWVA